MVKVKPKKFEVKQFNRLISDIFFADRPMIVGLNNSFGFDMSFGRKTANIIIKNRIVYQEL